jgi:Tfp pilus assembly protein PilF
MMPTIRVAVLAGLCCLGEMISESVWAQSCEPWTARVISVQGSVRIQRGVSAAGALAAKLDDLLCVGDQVLVDAYSRAALVLRDETVVRLDANTRITLQPPQDQKVSWLEVLKGLIHIVSRDPRALTVVTPFANAGIEGTEFLVEVTDAQASVTVFEGKVAVRSTAGVATAVSGEQVIATPGRIASQPVTVRPPDAVVWALYYPPVLVGAALPAADAAAPANADARFFTERAAARLAVGRVTEAQADLDQATQRAPGNAEALALRSIIALTQNDSQRAFELASEARERDPGSAAALLAYSYAQQARFDIPGALDTLQTAAEKNPADALVRARLSELWLAVRDLDRSVAAAEQAVALNADVALSQAVLGFAYLARIDTANAKIAFGKAIALDAAAPLPRLGLGLALIREGELAAGRAELENAVILDPGSAIIRSYMGKAYYEEKRDKLAESQLAIAKELDALDPTPWFYDAIRKQTVNRPVEALEDLQRSIEKNDNRAVYRSRFLLDQDLAARSASVGRIYRDLGFEELALREGWKSVAIDPSDYSGHRLLADSYSSLPRHEIARVDELFQSQLLQPANITPVQPQLADANLFILDSAGPGGISYNEFNPLFNRDRLAVQGSGVFGGNNTWGADAVLSGIEGPWSFSVGGFHFETDGFRDNNDLDQDLANALVQYQPSDSTSVIAEVRGGERDYGDLATRFIPNPFLGALRHSDDTASARVGVRHDFSERSTGLALLGYESDTNLGYSTASSFRDDNDFDVYTGELQYLYRAPSWGLTTGARYYVADNDEQISFLVPIPDPPYEIPYSLDFAYRPRDISVYSYADVALPGHLTLTVGASFDDVQGGTFDRNELNPKFGLMWQPRDGTTVRLAAFQSVVRLSPSRQNIQPSLEPTPVTGFNQFFYGSEAERDRRYGLAVDQRISASVSAGVEGSKRHLDIPFMRQLPPPTPGFEIVTTKVEEANVRAYLYWSASPRVAAGAEYEYDLFDNDAEFTPLGYVTLETHLVPLHVDYFHPNGFSGGVMATWARQRGNFTEFFPPFATFRDDDDFWVVDAYLQYRLPRRWGIVRLEARNALDEEFQYQDVDPETPRIYPERVLLLKFTAAY